MKIARFAIFYFLLNINFFLFAAPAHAEGEFRTNYQTAYTIDANGNAAVSQQITLTNNFSKIYANSYVLTLEGKQPEQISATQNGNTIPIDVQQEDVKTKITLNFSEALVGKGKSRTFEIGYQVKQVATQNGSVWELTIPKLAAAETVDNYALVVSVPKAFGNPAYISPQPKSKTASENNQNFVFAKDDLTRAGVVAAFGDFQVYDFNLVYHLQNPYQQHGETEVALPPDTAFQRVYYKEINPMPESIRIDEDGNWIAKYKLDPKQSLDVNVNLSAQVFSEPQQLFPNENSSTKDFYLSDSKYWQVNDPEIQELARSLKTPRNIYNFAVNYLKYDYSRVRDDVARLGAKNALARPNEAICTEYTDLFVALARAAGIPAREVNGYAYTNNPQIQPLSLVADILHAWPEYWDPDLKAWKPVDPTWENTTGGIDFFDKFDLAHVAFAIHGKSPDFPLPAGSYKSPNSPQKDVSVQFGQLPATRKSTLKIESTSSALILPFKPSQLHLKLTNSGPVALYDIPVVLETINAQIINDVPKSIKFLAPYSSDSIDITFKIPFSIRGKPSVIKASSQDATMEYNIPVKQSYIIQFAFVFVAILFLFVALVFTPRLLVKVGHILKK
ncbi:MAG: hypothetical protein A3D24_03100 [Candidatus Blackburnbacteria bacterium RIFCSPHIGHO2_02_FULL_39_13]|uniref:Transglutaminase-like domain-containing protein n=1 Tax=Candidatus Blackburnbacteria bacterium RIFCSPLOWO2_01_FULL_40_20 TaxID=1797519 RepID=A0A1G1VCF6_9BACT|nr:MAG: hypothetical protein A2694_00925 [Candidatus Blackburnbacteria bacterium RIFCSPHIGHO2_01_FULL_40_17]OGY09126.1 MAG: hypothetical protein A3D24_03100 [Candidatus Blackburnbacteria bacterium RIFCSPHIGHO2_02_FULL_39_13]OGY13070.1 MAG: hypothetical protein A3A77_03325 [Candidatus Blackburnbacteria bacterium RIFCSPLOWO2_01_FULL_40_20]